MRAEPKFRATCESCGERQPRATTAWTVEAWMRKHKSTHDAASEAE